MLWDAKNYTRSNRILKDYETQITGSVLTKVANLFNLWKDIVAKIMPTYYLSGVTSFASVDKYRPS